MFSSFAQQGRVGEFEKRWVVITAPPPPQDLPQITHRRKLFSGLTFSCFFGKKVKTLKFRIYTTTSCFIRIVQKGEVFFWKKNVAFLNLLYYMMFYRNYSNSLDFVNWNPILFLFYKSYGVSPGFLQN